MANTFLASLFATILCISACDSSGSHACTLIGCEDGFGVAFDARDWPGGDYVVTVDADGQARTCTVTLPYATVETGATCSDGLRLDTSGSALPASEHEILGLHVTDTPASLTVTITRDSVMLATESFTPSYITTQPNGPGCEPVCTQANATMSF
ncbi:MAG: hypothetical protein IPK60_21980 [Sandaracinaceae bacterium]|jgi:hypothetical protein|nr:hypothetical protein [Sandaracinaceae bacterium]